ncbi:MAG: hypothetical protein QGI78_01525 [Phycisphaerales bacterium]|jgi:hypothetical protein|nr:hypothetical protein [Phycisphaerales bacterium]
MKRLLNTLVCVFGLFFVAPSYAIPIDSIVSKNTSPAAAKGGVLMVPLLSNEQGDQWPTTIPVTFEDGRIAEGLLGWVEVNSDTSSWVDDQVFVRPITSSDSTASIHPKDTMSGPVLFVQVPPDVTGSVFFGSEYIFPKWLDLPPTFPDIDFTNADSDKQLVYERAAYLPPTNAIHYWRWCLLASRVQKLPPEPPNNTSVEYLAALYGEQLWRIGFTNLASASRSVAATCRDLLTDTASDGSHRFACWVDSPQSLEELLSILVDETLTSKQRATQALRWCDVQSRSLVWFASIFGDTVTLKFANSSPTPTLCRFQWEGENEIPLAVEVPPYETDLVTIERPQTVDLSIFGPVVTPSTQKLRLRTNVGSTVFPIEEKTLDAKPPYLRLPPLSPTWTLATLRRGYVTPVDDSMKTLVEVRFIKGSWELFLKCYGNESNPETNTGEIPVGTEAVTLFLNGLPPVVIQPTGVSHNNLSIFTNSESDRWSARVVLPDSFIRNGQVSFAIVRTHGNSDQIETAPLPCVPWNIIPAPVVINTTLWNTIDSVPITPTVQ